MMSHNSSTSEASTTQVITTGTTHGVTAGYHNIFNLVKCANNARHVREIRLRPRRSYIFVVVSGSCIISTLT